MIRRLAVAIVIMTVNGNDQLVCAGFKLDISHRRLFENSLCTL